MNPIVIGIRKLRGAIRHYRNRWRNRGIPVIDGSQREVFSIGIYEGRSPYDLRPAKGITNPVITRDDVTDMDADLVADPFMVRHDGQWFLFFEAMNSLTRRGQIAVAISADGLHWEYQRIVLDEPFHLSYPHVFFWENDHYMIPESYEVGAIRLYKAVKFPFEWEFVKNLVEGEVLVDPSPLFDHGRWWLFAASGSEAQWHSSDLRLFHADHLEGPWREHPQSPVVRNDMRIARPGGRVRRVDGKIIRFTQDCHQLYGRLVRAFEVTVLTETIYQERPVRRRPVLSPTGSGWNSVGMHHVDAHMTDDGRWLACVDGWALENKPSRDAGSHSSR